MLFSSHFRYSVSNIPSTKNSRNRQKKDSSHEESFQKIKSYKPF